MGNEATLLTASDARHLLRRTGFDAPATKVKSLTGKTRGAAADGLLKFTPRKFKPRGKDIREVHDSWLNYIISTSGQLQEKLVLFWHDHFATSYSTVQDEVLMANQNQRLRQYCKGNFRDFVKAINTDAAMMEFLDTVRNSKNSPNENYARELMELFTLGVYDASGANNYEQQDIVQIARAFSGWRYYKADDDGPFGVPYLNSGRHDSGTNKVVFTTVGGFGPAGENIAKNGTGEVEIDTVIDIIFSHRDSDNASTVARYITRKLLEYFAHASPDTTVVDEVITTSGFDTSWDIGALMRAILVHDFFFESGAAAPFGSAPKSVKWPVHYVVGALRQLKMRLIYTTYEDDNKQKRRYYHVARVNSEGKLVNGTPIQDLLEDMGQVLLQPPSVFGWDWETAWVNSGALLGRFTFARDVTAARATGRIAFRPEKLIDLGLTDPGAIVDAVTDVFGITDQFTGAERDILIDYLTDNGTVTPNLNDYDYRNTKLNGVFALLLQSPSYQLQ